MSRFTQFYVAKQLRHMGWPKSKGIFRKDYVDTRLLDVVVQGAIQVSVGLGAGRPQLGIAVLADTFANNPWTTESTTKLLRILKEGEHEIENNPESLPWEALYLKHRIAPNGHDIPWKQLDDAAILWAMISAQGIFWGLTHERDMPGIFAKDKANYERTAIEAIAAGVTGSGKYPWKSLEHFYEVCEDLVRDFESVRPPLREIPSALQTAPEIARALRTES